MERKVTPEEIKSWKKILISNQKKFTQNRDRIRILKELINISEDEKKHEAYVREKQMKINTLNCKTELAELLGENDKIKSLLTTLKSNLEYAGVDWEDLIE